MPGGPHSPCTRYTNRLNAENSRGIRNVPLRFQQRFLIGWRMQSWNVNNEQSADEYSWNNPVLISIHNYLEVLRATKMIVYAFFLRRPSAATCRIIQTTGDNCRGTTSGPKYYTLCPIHTAAPKATKPSRLVAYGDVDWVGNSVQESWTVCENLWHYLIVYCLIHRVKWRHRIYGYSTIAILWVYHDIMRWVKWRRFIVLFK